MGFEVSRERIGHPIPVDIDRSGKERPGILVKSLMDSGHIFIFRRIFPAVGLSKRHGFRLQIQSPVRTALAAPDSEDGWQDSGDGLISHSHVKMDDRPAVPIQIRRDMPAIIHEKLMFLTCGAVFVGPGTKGRGSCGDSGSADLLPQGFRQLGRSGSTDRRSHSGNRLCWNSCRGFCSRAADRPAAADP